MKRKLKLVLDTNIIISAFLFEGNEAKLLRKIENNEALIFVNNEILKEIKDVIYRYEFKYLLDRAGRTAEQVFSKIVALSHLVVGPKLKEIIIKVDPSDDKFLECAINTKADYIVSGDKHLLNLKKFKSIKIVRTTDILKMLR